MRLALSLAALLALALPAREALAHGRPPFVGDLRVHPTDPEVLVVRATWGLAITEDGGESWRWTCAAVAEVDPVLEDPAFEVMPDGSVLIGSFNGLSRSTTDRCEFTYPDPDLEDVYIIDVRRSPSVPSTVYAVLTDGAGPDSLWRSEDAGLSWDPIGEPVEDILLERVRVAPSDPSRVYLSGAIPAASASAERQAFVLRSSDGGESFERTQITLTDGERNVHLFDVDPTSPDRLLARVVRRATDTRPERLLLSEDGGLTFVTALEARELSDAAFAPDGAQAFATSATVDGLFRSDDAGLSFASLTQGNFLCTETREGELFVCADELVEGVSLVASDDAGDTLDPRLYFHQIYDLPDCPRCSEVGYVCPQWFPDLAYDLRLDAGVDMRFDGGMTGVPRDAAPPLECLGEAGVPRDAGVDAGSGMTGSGCGCAVRPSSAAPAWLAVIGVIAVVRRRRPLTLRDPAP